MEQITFNPNNEPYYSEDFIKGFKCGAQRQFEADVTDRRKEAPSIDIVRCAECKWFDSKGHCMRLTAEYEIYEDVGLDDFCSYGQKGDENVETD